VAGVENKIPEGQKGYCEVKERAVKLDFTALSTTSTPVNVMPRRHSSELTIEWKLSMPATLAGRIENVLGDPVTGKPIYGIRTQLLTLLLERWLAEQRGDIPELLPKIPTIEQLRAM